MTHIDKVLLMGSGSLAVDLLDMFGREVFAGAFVDAGFELTGLNDLSRVHDLADSARRGQRFLLAVADAAQRRRFADLAEGAGLRPCEPMVSRHAVVARSASLAAGSVVAHFVVVGPAAHLMPLVLVMHNAVVGHDSVLHHNCVVCAGASIAGGVQLGADSFVGPNAGHCTQGTHCGRLVPFCRHGMFAQRRPAQCSDRQPGTPSRSRSISALVTARSPAARRPSLVRSRRSCTVSSDALMLWL